MIAEPLTFLRLKSSGSHGITMEGDVSIAFLIIFNYYIFHLKLFSWKIKVNFMQFNYQI